LKNLVIVAQIVEPARTTVQHLSNISLDVPDSLVQIPSDYKRRKGKRKKTGP
jgi:hypothetical protein